MTELFENISTHPWVSIFLLLALEMVCETIIYVIRALSGTDDAN